MTPKRNDPMNSAKTTLPCQSKELSWFSARALSRLVPGVLRGVEELASTGRMKNDTRNMNESGMMGREKI
eukprot:COSAG06_NODE_37980_length_428_cov_35.328267_1_plen_69_part_01